MAASRAEAALALAETGYPVFPLTSPIQLQDGGFVCSCGTVRCERAAKHPIGRLAPNGLKNATIDPKVIERWWRSFPEANIGIATGRAIILDIDPRHGGDDALSELEANHGALPHTWRVMTGGGGEHIYFAPPPQEIRNSEGKLGPGLDIRGVGGYVVAPPSLHISGRLYAWSVDHHPDETPLAVMPDWLVNRLAEPVQRSNDIVGGWRELSARGVSDGQRNTAVAKLTGHLLRRYLDPIVTHELLQAWNAARCQPPLSPEEVTRTVNSIAKRELRRREARHGQPR